MKKIILALVSFLTLSTAVNAQVTLAFTTPKDTIWVNDEESVEDIYRLTYVTHTGASAITAVWVREVISLNAGWSTAVCDKNLCWDTSVSSKEFLIDPSEEADVYAHFYTNGICGTGALRLIVHEKENADNADTLIIMTRSICLSVNDIVKEDINVYPNPAKNSLTVNLPITANGGVVEVYDMLGNKIITNQVVGDEHIVNVANLPVGKYVLRYIDKNGNAYNKRFQKVN